MGRSTKIWLALVFAGLFTCSAVSAALAEDLVVRSCSELLRLADSCKDDLKTADTVLGSAIDMGSVEMIRNYKLKKEAAKKELDSVTKALELKGCVKPR
jgi:hypothetical protein